MTCRDGCVLTLDAHAVLGSTSRLTALPSRSSATSNSREACMFIENRGVVPKERDSRRAVSAVMPRFSLTMSLMGVAGTRSAWANWCAHMPRGDRNSSRRISPGGKEEWLPTKKQKRGAYGKSVESRGGLLF